LKKIKILHIIKSLGRGGAETLLPSTLKLHDKEQFEFHYIYFLPWKNQMVKEIKQNGGKVTCLPAKNNIKLLTRYKQIISYCKQNQIDLIHAHLPWAGFVSRRVHRKTGIPVIYTEHNMQERYHIVTKLLNKYTYNWQNLAIAVSTDVANSVQKNISPKIPVKIIPNGVNTEIFKRNEKEGKQIRQELDIPEDAIVIGNVAVFRFQKRLKEWIQVLHKLIEKHPNAYGLIVGDGPLAAEIQSEIKSLNIRNHIKLAGLQTEVKPYFSAMDIFMMTSSFEGLPIALLEAMSMSCAIATTDAGGIKEVIRNNQDGIVVPVESWKGLPEEVSSIINNPAKLKQLQQAARERAIHNFSLQKMAHELEKTYKQTLKQL